MDDGLFSRPDDAKYVSQAGRLLTPLGLRTSLEVVGDHVLTNERPNNLFRIKTQTSQASAIVRTALSGLLPPAVGDLLGGVELKHQLRTTIFDGTPVAEGSADVAQLVVGERALVGQFGRQHPRRPFQVQSRRHPHRQQFGRLERLHQWTHHRRADQSRNLEFGRVTPLPKGLSLKSEVSVLASSKPFRTPNASGWRGIHAVRGYVTEDGAVDQGMILRNSLYVSMPNMPAWMRHAGAVPPGRRRVGRDLFSGATHAVIGRAGFDFAAGSNFNSKLLAARAMTDGLHTPAGSWRVSVQASVSY